MSDINTYNFEYKYDFPEYEYFNDMKECSFIDNHMRSGFILTKEKLPIHFSYNDNIFTILYKENKIDEFIAIIDNIFEKYTYNISCNIIKYLCNIQYYFNLAIYDNNMKLVSYLWDKFSHIIDLHINNYEFYSNINSKLVSDDYTDYYNDFSVDIDADFTYNVFLYHACCFKYKKMLKFLVKNLDKSIVSNNILLYCKNIIKDEKKLLKILNKL